MHASHTTPTTTVILSRFRSAMDEPPNAVDIPPPKRSDIPPPRLLWTKIASVSKMLVMIRMIDSAKMGAVMSSGVRSVTGSF